MNKTRQKKKKDILAWIRGLDISPTMHQNAVDKYEALSKMLNENGIPCKILPQGSFATGTVVRPIKDEQDADYDLDVVCVIEREKNNTSPKEIKTDVGKALEKCGHYKSFSECEECWTIKFSELNDIGFNIDVVTSVDENADTKAKLTEMVDNDTKYLIQNSVTMSKGLCKSSDCRWHTINPQGYKEWFDSINNRFENYTREQRSVLMSESFAAESESIPSDELRSSLQIAIQIMKRHRDLYYSQKNIENLKPISAIITTLAAKIASTSDRVDLDPFEMLSYILENVNEYSGLIKLTESTGVFVNKKILQKSGGKWVMKNPVNPVDNLMDSWNTDTAKNFFCWITDIKTCFIDSLDLNDDVFIESICRGFGKHYISESTIYKEYANSPLIYTDIPTVEVKPKKPWRKNNI